jgi:molecular chaperone GrpE (heat shock protein)
MRYKTDFLNGVVVVIDIKTNRTLTLDEIVNKINDLVEYNDQLKEKFITAKNAFNDISKKLEKEKETHPKGDINDIFNDIFNDKK